MKSVTQFLRIQNGHAFPHKILHAPYMGQKELESQKVSKMEQRYINIDILKEDVASVCPTSQNRPRKTQPYVFLRAFLRSAGTSTTP